MIVYLLSSLRGRVFLLTLFGALAGGYWILFIPSYYFIIPVQIDNQWNIPLVQLEIANKKYEAELDLGAKLSTLSKSDLADIDKNYCENISNFDVHGKDYERIVYQVSGVKIHDFVLSKLRIGEESPEFLANSVIDGDKNSFPYDGRLGREVFDGKNFLLDFPKFKIILCKNFKDLSKDHYNLKDFIKTSFFIDKKIGICFQIGTDFGMKTFLLDSGSSISFTRPSAGEEELSTEVCHGLPVWRSKKFVLGDHDFGERKLYFLKMTSRLSEIDGFLGMDFLKEHAIYLDMEHSVAYIAKSSTANR